MKQFDEKDLEEARKSAKASLECEGFTVTEEDEALVRKRLLGEITHQEFIRLAREQARRESSK